MSQASKFPVLPLRDIVVFPNMVVPLFVGREKSVRALEEVINSERRLLLVAQKAPDVDDPDADQLYSVGTLANVLQLVKLPNGTVKVLVGGVKRVRVEEYVEAETHFEALALEVEDRLGEESEMKAFTKTAKEGFARYIKGKKTIPDEVSEELDELEDCVKVADLIAGHLGVGVPKKQELLEMDDVATRMEKIISLLHSEMSAMQVEKKIKHRVKSQMERTQREYYLNEQMKAIQKELGDKDAKSEIEELELKIKQTKFSDEACERATSELKKLSQMGPNSSEATVVRNYIDWLLAIPWGDKKKIKGDIAKAENVLNRDHYGLDNVKERIIEYIAVQQRTEKISGQILCLVGPPGVGKTSLGKSIASATGRDFVRVSLGGVRDEAEIRGHRRTYIGAMPGKIIQSLRKGKSVNPLILLDEIDKLGSHHRGDPASAMLEVLDPEQNSAFVDHYLDVDYDLSEVMFVTTANHLHNIPEPLRDRMEIISLPGYTEDEKIEIAKRHIMPKQRATHGIKPNEIRISSRAVMEIIRTYTHEAGVRNMEREIAKLVRKTVTKLVKNEIKSASITPKRLEEYLGVPPFRYGLAEKSDQVGASTGLAWTQAGGNLLSIEALVLPGKGRMKTTGKLGSVMKESVDAASSYVRSISPEVGVVPSRFEKIDIHIHVPEGATPKEGPSAGVAMVTSIVSVLTGIPVRREVAMTGEITLRGNVLPIGGLKAKLLAAIRGGIKIVLFPEDNLRELSEIPDEIKDQLELIPVSKVSDVLSMALVREPIPIEWDYGLTHDSSLASVANPKEGTSLSEH